MLENESRLKSVALTEVQRQTKKDYREAIQELRKNPERGFQKLDAIGAVPEVVWPDRAEAVAQAFGASQGRSSLVVCATHEEIERVTDAIRRRRKTAGAQGEGVLLTRHTSLNWTTAQKGDARNFRPGQILGFHRAIKGIARNEVLEVVRVEGERVIVRNEAGGEQTVTSRHAKSFDVLEQRPIEVAAGDRLLLTANRREPVFHATNGEIVTVGQVDAAGRIRLEDGRTLPPDYRQFAHGYAVTAHRSQGKSVDAVIISADGMQKELFYVAASRGRESVQVITSDREGLRETVARSTVRKSASELARRGGPGLQRGQALRPLRRSLFPALGDAPGELLLLRSLFRGRQRAVVACHQPPVGGAVQQHDIVNPDVLGFHPALGVQVPQIHPFRKAVVPGHLPVALLVCDGAADDLAHVRLAQQGCRRSQGQQQRTRLERDFHLSLGFPFVRPYSVCGAPEGVAVAWRVFTNSACRSPRTPGSPFANSAVIGSRRLKRSSRGLLTLASGA